MASVAGATAASTLEAPFVGRDDEMRLLKELFHATNRERRPRLVSASSARAASARSRLAWEFLKYVDGLSGDRAGGTTAAARRTARASPSGHSARWSASVPVCVETDDEQTTREKIAASLREHVPDEERADGRSSARCWRCWASRSGVDPQQLFGAWRTFFERLADSEPGGDGLRGPPFRRPGTARLHRSHARVEPLVADHDRHPGPAGAARQAAELGRRQAQLQLDLPRAADGRADARAARGTCARPAAESGQRDRRARRRDPAVRGRDRAHARRRRTAGSSKEASTSRPATSTTSPCRKR